MKRVLQNVGILAALFLVCNPAGAANAPTEGDYYTLESLPIPDPIVLEAGGLVFLPDGKLAVSTRRGDIYLVENVLQHPTKKVSYTLYAEGLHEVLGLAYRDGWIYATQRGELTRLKDDNGDGRADRVQTVSDGWEITGDYHEYAFGSPFDKDGNIWIVLCLTGSFDSNAKYRGWCVRVTPEGKCLPTCSGIRSPGGIGFNDVGDVFYTDNQGPWNGTCSLKHLVPGSFQGHPGGNRWYSETKEIGPRPPDPVSGSRTHVEAKRIPQYVPPAVLFPYSKMGQSAAGMACDLSAGKFGPFQNQMFVAELTHSTVMRVFLEKVNGRYQGAVFPFRENFDSGNLSMLQAADGTMMVGASNRGWGSRGPKPYALQRLRWTGNVPFEVHEMRAKTDGFELTFTQPAEVQTLNNPRSYKLSTYTYIFQSAYGSPEVDQAELPVERAVASPDGRSVRLYVKQLREGHVHELHIDGVRDTHNHPLLHKQAYYTMNQIPSAR